MNLNVLGKFKVVIQVYAVRAELAGQDVYEEQLSEIPEPSQLRKWLLDYFLASLRPVMNYSQLEHSDLCHR